MNKFVRKKIENFKNPISICIVITVLLGALALVTSNFVLAADPLPYKGKYPFTWHFEAVITNTTKLDKFPQAAKYVHVGDHIIGSVTYDLKPDDITLSNEGAIKGAIYGFFTPTPFDITMKVNNFAFGTNPFHVRGSVFVGDGPALPSGVIPTDESHTDEIEIASIETGLTNSPLDGMSILELAIVFLDPTGHALSTYALPPYSPDVSQWQTHALCITNSREPTGPSICANIISTW